MSDLSFSERMRQLRQDRGISLRGLARRTFYGKTYLHELETGVKPPTKAVAQRVDDALGAEGELMALTAGGPAIGRRGFVIAAAGLAAALPHTLLSHGRRVGAATPGQIAERTARLRRLDSYLGGADTHDLYAAEVRSTTQLIKDGSYSEATGQQLLAVLAEQAQLAGWAAFDAGRHSDADRLYRTSLAAARDADNPPLTGNALAFLAYQQLDLGRPATATAAASCAEANTATPGVRALLNLRAGWAYAVTGDAAQTQQHLDQGTAYLAEHDDRPEPDWVWWVDRVEGDIMAGRCWTVLNRPLRAIPGLERALAGFDDTQARDKSLYLSWLADAYLDANEVEQACATASVVARLAAGVGSIRPGQRLHEILGRLEPHAALPCVAELRSLASEMPTHHRLSSTPNSGSR